MPSPINVLKTLAPPGARTAVGTRARPAVRRLIGLCAAAALLAATIGGGSAARAQIQGLAAFGDSLSEEYFANGYSYAQSWFEQIHQHRGGIGGPYGVRGDTRGEGYEYNWSLWGASASQVHSIITNNLTTIQGQVTSGNVTHAVLYAGTNDYGAWSDAYERIYYGTWTQGQIDSYREGVVSEIRGAVEKLQGTGVSLVLSGVQDFGLGPFRLGNYDTFGDPARRQLVANALSDFNDDLKALALEKNIAFVDMLNFSYAVHGTHDAPNATLSVGGQNIQMTGAGTGTTNAYVADRIHHHSVYQGLVANLFLEAFERQYNAGTPTFSEQEIVTNAGLAYGGDTLGIDLSQFVYTSVAIPEPGTLALLLPGCGALWLLRRRIQRSA
jgi:PEP-CTERM putative exosortase interaction domain